MRSGRAATRRSNRWKTFFSIRPSCERLRFKTRSSNWESPTSKRGPRMSSFTGWRSKPRRSSKESTPSVTKKTRNVLRLNLSSLNWTRTSAFRPSTRRRVSLVVRYGTRSRRTRSWKTKLAFSSSRLTTDSLLLIWDQRTKLMITRTRRSDAKRFLSRASCWKLFSSKRKRWCSSRTSWIVSEPVPSHHLHISKNLSTQMSDDQVKQAQSA